MRGEGLLYLLVIIVKLLKLTNPSACMSIIT
jgi:hypothetical protein